MADVHLTLWLRYGIALESNQQNAILSMTPDEALTLVMKDNDAARIFVQDDLALAQMFITITLQLCLAAVLENLAVAQVVDRTWGYQTLRAACPHCGSPVHVAVERSVGAFLCLGILILPIIFVWLLLRKGYSKTVRVWGFIYLLISLLVFPSIFNSESPDNTSSKSDSYTAKASKNDGRPDVKNMTQFSAQNIADAYDKNTVSADHQFKGKWILMSGVVAEINTDFTGSAYVLFNVKNQFNAPQAKFINAENNSLALLEKGQRIRVLCIGNGDIAKTPMLKSCTLVN